MTRILLISGSTRDGSLHTAALRTAVRSAPPHVTAELYDGLRTVPAFVPGESSLAAEVVALHDRVAAADAVLLCTPEFAGSLPGSLKNLLDWLVDAGDLTGKPVAWLSVVPPGQDDGALATLETVLRHAGARVLRAACIRVPLTMADVDGGGLVTDHRLHVAIADMLRVLAQVLAAPQAQSAPSWQAYSSVYPVVAPRRDGSPSGRGWPPS